MINLNNNKNKYKYGEMIFTKNIRISVKPQNDGRYVKLHTEKSPNRKKLQSRSGTLYY